MKLLFNVIALLLATTALAAPVPSTPSDALTEGVSTGEHTLAHHHHVHNSKHAKHVHQEEPEVETRSLFNDELERRSFYDGQYAQLERRTKEKGKGTANPFSFSRISKIFKSNKTKNQPSGSTSNTGQPVNHEHALPSPVHNLHRSNSLPVPASPHHGEQSTSHAVNPSSPHSGSIRRPHRSNSVGSTSSLHGSDKSYPKYKSKQNNGRLSRGGPDQSLYRSNTVGSTSGSSHGSEKTTSNYILKEQSGRPSRGPVRSSYRSNTVGSTSSSSGSDETTSNYISKQ